MQSFESDSRTRQSRSNLFTPHHTVLTHADLSAGTVELALNGADDILIYSTLSAIVEYDATPAYSETKTAKIGAGGEAYSTRTMPYIRIRTPVALLRISAIPSQPLGRHGQLHVWAGFSDRLDILPPSTMWLPSNAITLGQAIAVAPASSTSTTLSDNAWDVGGRTPTDIWIVSWDVSETDAANSIPAVITDIFRVLLIKTDVPAGDQQSLITFGPCTALSYPVASWRPGVPVHIPLKDCLDERSAGAGALQIIVSHETNGAASTFWNHFITYQYLL